VAYDNAINLFANNISAAGTVQQAAKPVGRNRSFYAVGRVGGDVTGTTPTLTFTIEQSADGVSGFTQIAGPFTLTEMVGYVAGTTPRYEVPGLDAVKGAFNTTQDYVRAVTTAGGTSPVFPSVSIKLEPIVGAAFKQSGRS
jgi:hypothetical protein